jgi:hypothetical protein
MSANPSNYREQSEAESDASSGWRAEYAYQAVDVSIEPDIDGSRRDRLEAANRDDRPERYCRKHLDGRSS